jgi:hypothetical protein
MASFASFSDSAGGSPTFVHRQPSDRYDDGEAAPNPSQPSFSRLEDFRRLESLQDLPIDTRDLHEAGWRTSTESCYEAAWKSFKRHPRSSNVSLDRAGVTDIMNYLTLLYKRKLSYSTINIHRSAISMTLAKVDGAPLGGHSLITRLMKGIFTKRSPTRKVPSVWDPAPVLECFMHWSLPLSRAQLVRKCAFIIAITSARQLSELFFLKCVGNHIQVKDDFIQFVPLFHSKTDRAGHFGPPIRLKAWKEDTSICPVALACALLAERVNLGIRHDRLFFNIQHPDAEMFLSSFQRCICWCLKDAVIQAPPGSTRATAASSALGRGVFMANILHL